jgi:hypothetical protein
MGSMGSHKAGKKWASIAITVFAWLGVMVFISSVAHSSQFDLYSLPLCELAKIDLRSIPIV